MLVGWGAAGVARGCGWQQQVVYINLGSFYLIAMPLAILLAFKFLLHAKVGHTIYIFIILLILSSVPSNYFSFTIS